MKVYLGDFERGIGFFRAADGSDTLQGRVVNVGTESPRGILHTQGADYSQEYTEHVSRLAEHSRMDDDIAVRWDGKKYVIVYDADDSSASGKSL